MCTKCVPNVYQCVPMCAEFLWEVAFICVQGNTIGMSGTMHLEHNDFLLFRGKFVRECARIYAI